MAMLSVERGLIGIWAISLGLALSLMLSLHYLPHQNETIRGLPETAGLNVHHFLNEQCSCSKKLITHLSSRKAVPGVRETVHLIHARTETSAQLTAAGYQVEPVEEEIAARHFNLQALPQLVIRTGGETLYQGGYGPDQQHLAIYEDARLIQEPTRENLARAYPVFGCANGEVRKRATDLMGIKYGLK